MKWLTDLWKWMFWSKEKKAKIAAAVQKVIENREKLEQLQIEAEARKIMARPAYRKYTAEELLSEEELAELKKFRNGSIVGNSGNEVILPYGIGKSKSAEWYDKIDKSAKGLNTHNMVVDDYNTILRNTTDSKWREDAENQHLEDINNRFSIINTTPIHTDDARPGFLDGFGGGGYSGAGSGGGWEDSPSHSHSNFDSSPGYDSSPSSDSGSSNDSSSSYDSSSDSSSWSND